MSDFFDAIKQGQAEEVKRLLGLDPSLIHSKENGLSPVLVAAYHQNIDLANFLAEKKVSLTIYEAAALGKTDHVIRILAREPELVKAHAEDGFHLLGLACFFGHYETAKYLIKAGAAVNSASRNALQATPLHSAVAADNLEIVDLLVANGADPNTREQGGFAPLHLAAQNGNMDIIRALIFGGADLDAHSDDGKLPVDMALDANQEEAARLLLEGITRRTRARRANP
ncbi:MAG: ankyrin repeat domain-containing protein [Chloroflexi bacterium]|nr:ankyrin repeat domain-containing protein [Chloroflexota bacterium]